MRYHVTIYARTYVVDVDGGSVTIDGERLEAHAAAIPGTPLLHLLLGKDSWTVACQPLDGRRWALGAVGERVEDRIGGGLGRIRDLPRCVLHLDPDVERHRRAVGWARGENGVVILRDRVQQGVHVHVVG